MLGGDLDAGLLGEARPQEVPKEAMVTIPTGTIVGRRDEEAFACELAQDVLAVRAVGEPLGQLARDPLGEASSSSRTAPYQAATLSSPARSDKSRCPRGDSLGSAGEPAGQRARASANSFSATGPASRVFVGGSQWLLGSILSQEAAGFR